LEKHNQTARELTDRFEALSQDSILVQGSWKYAGIVYYDELVRFRIDTCDPGARSFVKQHKAIWKERYRQLDLWITVHEIEVI
jgi:hypothetical protein